MLPGVELARRRRVHYHGDVAAGEHHHHGSHAQYHHHPGGVAGPALAARIRLEEKLRGAGPPSLSRWSRLIRERDGRATSRHRNRQEQQQQEDILATGAELWPPPPPPPNPAILEEAAASTGRRAELRRTLSKVDLCAVCLDEVRERQQRVTRLPCSHKYHSECVLPWLAIQPDCPCCRTLVPSVDTLS
ncbi:uncharacterized protein LOC133886757 [Phragmites australis]|uniref:uncharacterized protein LOC133886757 n=1 Tax=Phragmites australis TaxID=29695 RepID=UPI002D7855AC|nr:uncharacterized protein LOC133886757 [Phragmites australis]